MGRRLRWTFFVGTAVAVVAIVWWRASGEALPVTTAIVARGPFEETLVEDGRTRVRWHVDVTAPVTGEWTPGALRVGDTVAAGALLGTLTAAPADPASARQVTAELGVADANLVAARAAEAAAIAAQAEADRAQGRAERLGAAGGVTDELGRIRSPRRVSASAMPQARVPPRPSRDAARALLPGGGDGAGHRPGAGVVYGWTRSMRASSAPRRDDRRPSCSRSSWTSSAPTPRIPVGAKMRVVGEVDSVGRVLRRAVAPPCVRHSASTSGACR
jgi:hypothetical protein